MLLFLHLLTDSLIFQECYWRIRQSLSSIILRQHCDLITAALENRLTIQEDTDPQPEIEPELPVESSDDEDIFDRVRTIMNHSVPAKSSGSISTPDPQGYSSDKNNKDNPEDSNINVVTGESQNTNSTKKARKRITVATGSDSENDNDDFNGDNEGDKENVDNSNVGENASTSNRSRKTVLTLNSDSESQNGDDGGIEDSKRSRIDSDSDTYTVPQVKRTRIILSDDDD